MSCLSWRGIFHESWKNKIEIRMGGLRETGASLLFSLRRAHLLTTASAQTPYPSPRRKRQVSSIPLCLLFPQSQRLCGSPFAAVVFPAEIVRSARRMRLLRQPPDNATALAGCCCHRLRRSQLFPLWKQSAPCPRKPATGSFACGYAPKLDSGAFSLLRKRNRKRKNEVKKIWRFIIWKRRWSAGAQAAPQ